jgi:hypothetical protein
MLMNIMTAVFWNVKMQFHSVHVSEEPTVGSFRMLLPTFVTTWCLIPV